MHPTSLSHLMKFETIGTCTQKDKVLTTPSVLNAGLQHFATVNIVKEKKQHQRLMKVRLNQFLKDYRQNKE